jgi:hypothetical protein
MTGASKRALGAIQIPQRKEIVKDSDTFLIPNFFMALISRRISRLQGAERL